MQDPLNEIKPPEPAIPHKLYEGIVPQATNKKTGIDWSTIKELLKYIWKRIFK